MDTTVWITLIGFASLLVTSIAAPLLIKRSADTSLAAAKAAERDQDRKDKEEERARQQRNIDEERARQERISDKVNAAALQTAETAAKLLAAAQAKQSAEDAERARLLVESNQRIAAAAAALSKVTNDKVDLVHGIVNSSFTAALQAELNATMRELMLAQEVIELKKAAGKDSNGASEKLIAVTKARIAELNESIAERLKQAKVSAVIVKDQQPLPVTDERTAAASERVANAAERSADATGRVADAAEDLKK